VDESVRDQWILEAAKLTRARLRATKAVLDVDNATADQLEKRGVPPHLIDGVLLAKEKYAGDVDLDFFDRLAKDAVSGIVQGGTFPAATKVPPAMTAAAKAKGPGEDVEKEVLAIIQGLAATDEKGAQWDLIVSQGEKKKITEEQVEEALNSLMDKGVVYEPILGRLKMA
jgi:hypothetical protein